ncbi:MAG TPA: 2-oxoglutarate dehydrogenase E1 component [Candidatus Krumholzibacteria bacterium]|nr:2-oxoglutarate dehydrogenase E1 component [Candidatus Krumholzibacteria bacterium]
MASPSISTSRGTSAERALVADLFRRYGHLQAALDPLERLRPLPVAELDALPPEQAAPWRRLYCGPIGVEFMHLLQPERRAWVAERLEAEPEPPDAKRILRLLATAELFEAFLHRRYVGTKRYSLEGAASLMPLLDAVLDGAAQQGVEVALICMAHRGRLTVMHQTVGVPAASLFAGFQDVDPRSFLGGGDVKYHLGATGNFTGASGKTVAVHLVSNPSHLEAVDPVLMGRVRARQERLGETGPRRVLGIAMHGDAAFAGQGIASETLNLASLRGTSVRGMVHIVVNNLIGFTTEPASLHSSRYSSDVAKRLDIPILHVSGDDPEAVVRAARIAIDYRATFESDVVLDMICYRRYGHSEVDDPTVTQPLLYRRIAALPRAWEAYAARRQTPAAELTALRDEIGAQLESEQERARAQRKKPKLRKLPAYWDAYFGGRYEPRFEVATQVPAERLEEIAAATRQIPSGFTVHPKVKQLMQQRDEMMRGSRPLDWGTAEALAWGSLLWDGMLVRLSGQDSRRATFNQRHAVLFDYETGAEHIPLRHLHPKQGRFDIYDSSLSEAAELGFQYGFSRDYPDALVAWEAQFGDFANGAQVILDQFVSAAEDKWDLLSGLVILLPHGFEGQGPEHSSARLERYLQLSADDNMQVCQPSTSGQYFHLLRRQALRRWRKPLVVLTPKSMLRAPQACSPRSALTDGSFLPLVGDPEHVAARRVLVASGKIVHELRAARQTRGRDDVAILALEQFHPFPEAEMRAALESFTQRREVVWVQEEPANMGGLFFVRPFLERLAAPAPCRSIKRSASGSPATGSAKAHDMEQKTLLELAFSPLEA